MSNLKSEKSISNEYSFSDYMKFIIPSVIALIIFLGPVTYKGHITTVLSYFIDSVRGLISKDNRVILTLFVVNIAAVLTILANYTNTKSKFLEKYMKTSHFWMFARILGAIIITMICFKIGPEMIWHKNTGRTMGSMSASIIVTFIIGGSILPFITNFGALEFVGTLLKKVMLKLFRIPGMAAIDCVVSWIGSSGLAMYYTSQLHKDGIYTDREAAVIATTFSLVSLPYLYTMVEMVNLGSRTYEFIFAAYSICFVLAVIMPRIWPLNRYPDTNIRNERIDRTEELNGSTSLFSDAVTAAVRKAQKGSVKEAAINGIQGGLGLCLSVVPTVLAFGTIALIVYEYTSILQAISLPFYWICNIVGIPEAQGAASAITIGYVDQTLAAVVGSAFVTDAAKFFSIIVATSGVLYIAQPVPIILGSSIPLGIRDITIIYIIRVVITIFLVLPFLKWFF